MALRSLVRAIGASPRGPWRSGLAASIALLAAGSALVLTPPALAQTSRATPRLEVSRPEIHLGELTRFDRAAGRFEIRNTGTGELKILAAAPG